MLRKLTVVFEYYDAVFRSTAMRILNSEIRNILNENFSLVGFKQSMILEESKSSFKVNLSLSVVLVLASLVLSVV